MIACGAYFLPKELRLAIKIHPEISVEDLYQIGLSRQEWSADPEALDRVEISYHRLLQQLEQPEARIYGIHTHYGYNVAETVVADAWPSHQEALLQYLKVGVGEPLEESIVRRALCLQAYKISLGYSGIHPSTYLALLRLSEGETLPEVPCFGSLGASGDLIPMAHATAPLFAKDSPRGPRDVIGLVNTNAMMASLAIDCWSKTWLFYRESHMLWLLHASALGWQNYGQQQEGWQARSSLRKFRSIWMKEIALTQKSLSPHRGPHPLVPTDLPAQERYSIRCAPQILQDLGENLLFAAAKIREEALGLADNPVVLENSMWHGGHFYTAGLATAADLMNDAVNRLADMIDRQILLLVTVDSNHGLPSNLSLHAGDHVKGLHQLASALLQRMKAHQAPARTLSFSCESNNQDVVPASMNALLQLKDLLELALHLSRIGSFIGERAWRLRHDLPIPESLQLNAWQQHQSAMSWQRGDFYLPFASSGSLSLLGEMAGKFC